MLFSSSVLLGKNERAHKSLRELAANKIEADGCFLGGIINLSPDDGLSLDAQVKKCCSSGYVVGKDTVGLSETIKRSIIIHTACVKLKHFSSKSGITILLTAIQIALFEPDHYQDVVVSRGATCPAQSRNDNAISNDTILAASKNPSVSELVGQILHHLF